jgi:phosphoribosylglycinamide formyltransferase 2
MNPAHLAEAQEMAARVTKELGGAGIWGVEFFITSEGAYFSELSPRPHDTGMVTLAGTQNLNEFELHARAVLGLPVTEIRQIQNGASAVILADQTSETAPRYLGIAQILTDLNTEVRIFGKPSTRPYRRMAVALCFGSDPVESLVQKAKLAAAAVELNYINE